MSYKSAIIIPARWGSQRLTGKPLAKIGHKTMIQRTFEVAKSAVTGLDIPIAVATDDDRIADHLREHNIPFVMTNSDCRTGTDRVYQATQKLGEPIDFVINLQGDAPFTPPEYITAILEAKETCQAEVITPVYSLSWKNLDLLREHKQHSPSSGTCAILNQKNEAIWFSKQIIPAIRQEDRQLHAKSPVYKHVGIYGYRLDFLKKYVTFEQTPYEKLEGLEQLRVLEKGYTIQACLVEESSIFLSGIDTQLDLTKANTYV